jgi:hypothetical protein
MWRCCLETTVSRSCCCYGPTIAFRLALSLCRASPNLANDAPLGGRDALGAINVSSAEEFYKNADEHFGWAESAKTERERAILLQMAAAWLEVAKRWEVATTTSSIESAPPRS